MSPPEECISLAMWFLMKHNFPCPRFILMPELSLEKKFFSCSDISPAQLVGKKIIAMINICLTLLMVCLSLLFQRYPAKKMMKIQQKIKKKYTATFYVHGFPWSICFGIAASCSAIALGIHPGGGARCVRRSTPGSHGIRAVG